LISSGHGFLIELYLVNLRSEKSIAKPVVAIMERRVARGQMGSIRYFRGMRTHGSALELEAQRRIAGRLLLERRKVSEVVKLVEASCPP